MRRLYRCRWDKKIGGVCGGLAQYFRCDPTIIRLLFVILSFFTLFIAVLIYILAWIILPEGPNAYIEIPCKKLYRSKRNRKISGSCGGLGEYFKIDPTFIRIALLVLMVVTFGFPIILTYLVGHFIIPENPNQ